MQCVTSTPVFQKSLKDSMMQVILQKGRRCSDEYTVELKDFCVIRLVYSVCSIKNKYNVNKNVRNFL